MKFKVGDLIFEKYDTVMKRVYRVYNITGTFSNPHIYYDIELINIDQHKRYTSINIRHAELNWVLCDYDFNNDLETILEEK